MNLKHPTSQRGDAGPEQVLRGAGDLQPQAGSRPAPANAGMQRIQKDGEVFHDSLLRQILSRNVDDQSAAAQVQTGSYTPRDAFSV